MNALQYIAATVDGLQTSKQRFKAVPGHVPEIENHEAIEEFCKHALPH